MEGSKNGGMQITLYQRDNGKVVTAYKINCYERNGELCSEISKIDNSDNSKELISKFETER